CVFFFVPSSPACCTSHSSSFFFSCYRPHCYLHSFPTRRSSDLFLTLWNKGTIQKSSRMTYDVVWNIILFFIIIGAMGIMFAGGVGAGYFASLVNDEHLRDYDEM